MTKEEKNKLYEMQKEIMKTISMEKKTENEGELPLPF